MENEDKSSVNNDGSIEPIESFEKHTMDVEAVETPPPSPKLPSQPQKTLSRHSSRTSMRDALEEVKRTLSGADEEDGIVYPKKYKLFLIMVALCLSVFLMALDNTIIGVAIPKIVR